MSKGKKVLILVGLFILTGAAFAALEGSKEAAQFRGFFGFMNFGLLIAIIVTALSRGESRRR